MKTSQLSLAILFTTLLSCNQSKNKSYHDADAVYLNLTKTYILNKDGSIVNSVKKEQKLLTYRSFQSLFGETRIDYNPDFQKVEIAGAYTINARNEKIEVPENGYNEVLPSFCQNTVAYSNIREMVVSHTGLERNATINCAYSVTTDASKVPFLIGKEELSADCPIEKLSVIVKVPVGTTLHYKAVNTIAKPIIEHDSDFDSYVWNFSDIPQRNNPTQYTINIGEPQLIFSTQNDESAVINWLTEQEAFRASLNDKIKIYVDDVIKERKTLVEKILGAQEIVVDEINTLNIPVQLIAFKTRTPDEVWQSNSGTPMEKSLLLTAILQAEDINAVTCLKIPVDLSDETSPFLLSSEPLVKVTTDDNQILLLSPIQLNKGNYNTSIDQFSILSLNRDGEKTIITNTLGRIMVKGQLAVSQDGRLKGELSGQFSNSFNPYNEIVRNQEKCPPFLPDFTFKVKKITIGQADITLDIDKGNGVKTRGDFNFVDIPESGFGIASLHLGILPTTSTSTINLASAIDESYQYSLSVPEGFRLANSINLELVKMNIGSVSIILKQNGETIEITRSIMIDKTTISTDEYPDFKELLDKWNTKKYKELVFKTI